MIKKNMIVLIATFHVCILALVLIYVLFIADRHSQLAITDVSRELTKEVLEINVKPQVEEPLSEAVTEVSAPAEPETSPITEESQTALQPDPIPFTYKPHRRRLNIREGPSLSAKIIGKVYPSTQGLILSVANDDWAMITYNGITGYSALEYMYYEEEAFEKLKEATLGKN